MTIHATIPDDPAPVYDGATLQMRFFVDVGGTRASGAITVEALEDHFGARSALEADLREAFDRGRERIAQACAEMLAEGHGGAVLHSGYFRAQRLAAAQRERDRS